MRTRPTFWTCGGFWKDRIGALSPADKKGVEEKTGRSGAKFGGFDANNEDHYHIAR